MRIRRAIASDLDALVELENGVFDYERMSARQLRHHLDNRSVSILVARRGVDLVGAAVLFFRKGSGIARLYSIAVAADVRGAGIGAALLAAAERAARTRGSRAMRLEVRADNPAAQRLYERRGYRRFAVKAGYYEDGHDAFRYEKPLGTKRPRP